jgi:hypothetical protein
MTSFFHLRRQAIWGMHIVALVVFSLSLSSNTSYADSPDSEHRSLVDSIGAMVYGFAWPTAEYERVSFGSARETSEGTEITFRVHGRSSFGGGPLWTDVAIELSDGQITDIRWGENNAILAQPGETVKALGQVLADLNNEYRSNAGSPSGGSTHSGVSSSQVLSSQFTRARTGVGAQGFSETHEVYTSNLGAGETRSITVTLRAGKTYIIVGTCDQDCSDLDLRLYDSTGSLLTSDEQDDDKPVVSVTPSRTADFTVKVVMAHCSREPCYFGTQIFGK